MLPKNPYVIIFALILIATFLAHPVWNFWWVQKKTSRRIVACLSVLAGLTVLGYAVWPKRATIPTAVPTQPPTPPSYAYIFAIEADHVPGTSGNVSVTLRRTIFFDWDSGDTSFQQACSQYGDTNSVWVNAKATTALSANTWYWIGCRWDGSTLAIFLNGSLEATSSVSTPRTVSQAPKIDKNYTDPGALGGSLSNNSVAGLAVWGNILPSNADLEYLTNPQNACSIDRGYYAPEGLKVDWAKRAALSLVDQRNSNSGNTYEHEHGRRPLQRAGEAQSYEASGPADRFLKWTIFPGQRKNHPAGRLAHLVRRNPTAERQSLRYGALVPGRLRCVASAAWDELHATLVTGRATQPTRMGEHW